ncbi:MAG: hypothetical protein KAI38_10415 [Candidatus Latescibacteria bacterium]|nr:hypothetical protein [Candidatus Latescibacterota bacterium]
MFSKFKLVLFTLCVMGFGSLVTDLAAQGPGPGETVNITPSGAKILVGHTRQFRVSGSEEETYTWSVIESGFADEVIVGTIDAEGLFTAMAGGYVILAVMEGEEIIASTDTLFVIGGPTKIGKARGGKVFSAGDTLVVVDFPPAACDRALTVQIEKRVQNELPTQAKGKGTAVAVFEFNVTDTETGENVGKTGFAARVRLRLHYNDEDVPEDVDEEDLVVTCFNEEEEEWEEVPEEDVVETDPEENMITIETDHASFWSVMDTTSLTVLEESTTWGQIKNLLR